MIITEFDFNVYGYLQTEGYTHLQLKGIPSVTQAGDHHYYVVPLKKDDPRIADLEWDGLAASLEEDETFALLEKNEYGKVMVEWSVAEYAAYVLSITK